MTILVYVGNLPKTLSETSLRTAMTKLGAGIAWLCLPGDVGTRPGCAILEFSSIDETRKGLAALRHTNDRVVVRVLPTTPVWSVAAALGVWCHLALEEVNFLARFVIRLLKDVGIFVVMWKSLVLVERTRQGSGDVPGYAALALPLIHEGAVIASYIILAALVIQDVWRMCFKDHQS